MGGIQGLSESALTCGFAIAVYSAHTLFEDSLNLLVDIFRLAEVDPTFKERMTQSILRFNRATIANEIEQGEVLHMLSEDGV